MNTPPDNQGWNGSRRIHFGGDAHRSGVLAAHGGYQEWT
jgi:hypothetical protein